MQNGLRTHRVSLDQYIFINETIESQVKTWLQGVRSGEASRCLLIKGPSGNGKTSLALACAEALGVAAASLREINCASVRGLDDAREIIPLFNQNPWAGNYQTFLFDEIHQMMPNAQQALLTPLENLPSKALVFACTTNPDQLVDTFKNRFYSISLEGEYDDDKILTILENAPRKEPPTPALLKAIIRSCGGVPRKALALLEGSDPKDAAALKKMVEEFAPVDSFISAVLQGKRKEAYLACRAADPNPQSQSIFLKEARQALEGVLHLMLEIPVGARDRAKAQENLKLVRESPLQNQAGWWLKILTLMTGRTTIQDVQLFLLHESFFPSSLK